VDGATFISYRRFRWLWITALALIVCLAVYVYDNPVGGRNGGTALGYIYGTAATIGIVWLMAFGLRKRAYSSSLGTLEGWLAAHVWIGVGLLLLVPLHAGFSFGCNVHTLAYVLMVITILSGMWGAMNYVQLSSKIESHRGGLKSQTILERLQSLDREIESLLSQRSDEFLGFVKRFDLSLKPGFMLLVFPRTIQGVDTKQAAALMLSLPDSERAEALRVLGMIDQKIDLSRDMVRESHIKMLLRVWLFIHVPASVALCGAVAIHIFSVFYMW
jgi:hypothetical protein